MIWNLWRAQRLILVKLGLITLETSLLHSNSPLLHQDLMARVEKHRQTLQDLVDAICHSVPFHLGNRTQPSSLPDFTDSTILLPSHHSLPADDARRLLWSEHATDMSEREHRDHIIARGPSHIKSPLSNLLALFSEEHGELMRRGIREGQLEWIRKQFLRVAVLMRLPARDGSGLEGIGEGKVRAEDLARAVREGAVFMSGL
jgi:hypothetical protein